MPVFFFPYYMRAYRLYLIHSAHLEHFDLKKKHGVFGFKKTRSLHFVREKNMLKWFVVIMIPIVVATFIAVTSLTLTNIGTYAWIKDMVPVVRGQDMLPWERLFHNWAWNNWSTLSTTSLRYYRGLLGIQLFNGCFVDDLAVPFAYDPARLLNHAWIPLGDSSPTGSRLPHLLLPYRGPLVLHLLLEQPRLPYGRAGPSSPMGLRLWTPARIVHIKCYNTLSN